MLKLAFLLIGPDAFKARWYALAGAGAFLLALAAALMTGLSPALTIATYLALGLGFLGSGLLMAVVALASAGPRRWLALTRPMMSILAGLLILGTAFETGWLLSTAFAIAFILDGAFRILMTLLTRFTGWVTSIACGVAELVLAVMMLAGWPFSGAWNVPFCIGLFIGLSGWLLIRLGLLLRGLEDEAAILLLPVFSGRGWYDHAPVLIGEAPPRGPDDPPIVVRIWMPAGPDRTRAGRPVIDRYLGAQDDEGVFSGGHASLELAPDVYISHWPATDFDLNGRGLMTVFSSRADNDMAGSFQRSYDEEAADWRPADLRIEVHRFNPRRLKAFWAGYKQDATYNVTNRNCSVVVAAGLDAALEGVLAGRHPWLRLLGLMIDPDLWVAAMIRTRASSMTWTPGLVLDYVRTLVRIVERRDLSWGRRFRGFLGRVDGEITDRGAPAA